MPRITGYLTTTACVMLATTALAQSNSDQVSNEDARSADTITCADIITMDTAVVPGVLYFVAGFQEGNKAGMSGSAPDSSDTASDTATTGTAGSGSTDPNASGADTTDTGTATTDNTPSTSADGTATTTDTSSSASTDGSGTAMDGGDKMRLMRVAGLYEIPVEKIMTVCGDTPDEKIGDIVKQHGDQSAKTSN